MTSRRNFLTKALLGAFGISIGKSALANPIRTETKATPTIISTWNNLPANKKAWKVIKKGGRALDAVEKGVRVAEADPKDMSVGYGGRPDRDGNVTLDACIMDDHGNCGSVCFLQKIKHPISVARLVMEETPHVMLAGAGAYKFALEKGFKSQNLLTAEAEENWKEWQKESKYQPIINIENHDTIGMLAIDQEGNLSGACTTSGAAFKMQGRVGDSPIIGAGLYVDNEIGGAVATGLGEAVIKSVGSFLVVELMRQGRSPQEACEEAIQRITSKQEGHKDFQVGYLAINKNGEIGAHGIHTGFSYALSRNDGHSVVDASSSL